MLINNDEYKIIHFYLQSYFEYYLIFDVYISYMLEIDKSRLFESDYG